MASQKVHSDRKESSDVVGIILIATLVGIPLAMAPRLLIGYVTTPKLAVAFIGVAWLLFAARRWWPSVRHLTSTEHGKWYLALLLMQVASLLISTALSPDWELSLAGTTSRRLGSISQLGIICLAAIAAGHVTVKRSFVAWLFLGIEVAGGIAATYGILQYFGVDPLLPATSYQDYSTSYVKRIPATFGHAMIFANFLLPVVLIAASSLIDKTSRLRRALHGVVFILTTVAIVLSGTRSALLGLIAGAALLTFLAKRRILLLFGVSAAALVLGLAVFAHLPAGRDFMVRISQWSNDSRGGPRLLVWRDTLPLIWKHWLVGIGPEEFAGEFRKVQSLQLAQEYPDHYHEVPHNLFLEVAVNQGLIGASVLIALLTLAVLSGIEQTKAGNRASRVLLASLAGLVVSLQFSPLAFTNVLYLYLFIGLLIGLSSRRFSSYLQAGALGPFHNAGLTAAGCCALLITGLYLSQDLYFAATARKLANGDVDGARESYNTARKFPFPGQELWCSHQWATLASSLAGLQRDTALADAKLASLDAEHDSEEKFDAYYQSAVLALVTSDDMQAETKLRESIIAAPRWYRPKAMLASLLLVSGRSTEAAEEERRALECAGSRGPEVEMMMQRARQQRYLPAKSK